MQQKKCSKNMKGPQKSCTIAISRFYREKKVAFLWISIAFKLLIVSSYVWHISLNLNTAATT